MPDTLFAKHQAAAKPTDIYHLFQEIPGRDRMLTPEEVAVALAKSSRSPLPFRQNAGLLTTEKAATFHDRYVLGYGHASVAELATGHACIENISMLTAKALEDGRLGSYIEASTRYQPWGPTSFIVPAELDDTLHGLREAYVEHCMRLFALYQETLDFLMEKFKGESPKPAAMSDSLYEANMRAKALDVARGLLPASATTMVGYVANARVAEHNLSKMLAHDLAEVRHLAHGLKETFKDQLPTLVKYVAAPPYLIEHRERMATIASTLLPRNRAVEHADSPTIAYQLGDSLWSEEQRIVAQALYPYTNLSLQRVTHVVALLKEPQFNAIWNAIFEGRGERDNAPRELETYPHTFDMIVDFGTWRDLQRHRMCLHLDQPLDPYLGFHMPEAARKYELADRWAEAMLGVQALYENIEAQCGQLVAQYCVPMCYNKRAVLACNLRELFSLIELRTKPGGHMNYRIAATLMADAVRQRYPRLVERMRVSPIDDTDAMKRIKEVKQMPANTGIPENTWDTIKGQTPAGPLIDGAADDFIGNPRPAEAPPTPEVIDPPRHHFTPGMRYDTYVLPDQRMVMVNSLYYVQIDLTTGEFMVRGHEEINTACAIADAQANEKLADAFMKSLAQPPLADTPAPAAPERATPLRAVGRIAGITPDALALNGKDFVRREEADNGQGQAQGVDRP